VQADFFDSFILQLIFALLLTNKTEMEEVSEKINNHQKTLQEDEIAVNTEYDKEINLLIRREEVMNSVLEKLIDKLNQPHTTINKG